MKATVYAEEDAVECRFDNEGTLTIRRAGEDRKSGSQSEFKLGERVVVCVHTPVAAYISVWDLPPNDGRVERLVPNELMAPGANAIRMDAGAKRCFGEPGAGYKILLPEDEGNGRGYMYLLATMSEEIHPKSNSFATAEFRASVVAENDTILEDFEGYADATVGYDVR